MSFAYLHECFPDPSKTFVYREVEAMRTIGMEPRVFSLRQPTAEERGRMETFNSPVHYLPAEPALRRQTDERRSTLSRSHRRALSHWRIKKGDSNRVFEALWLGHELRKYGIRHIHAHFAGMAARTAWLTRQLWGITYSFTGHADDIFSPERKPITLEMLIKGACFVATETDYSRARLLEEHPDAGRKTFRVFNGIDLSGDLKGTTNTAGRDSGTPRIISIGRLVEKKGFPDLVHALALLRDRGLSFECDLVGGGPLESDLRALIEKLGLRQHVVLHGVQSQKVVWSLLSRSRVFALAAQQEGDGGSDNLPTVIMEAMAAGLPVVSTRLAGIPEMICDGSTGKLVASRDVTAFAAALATYLSDPTLAATHGSRGQIVAGEKFSISESAHQLARLLVHHAGVTAPQAAIAARPDLEISWLGRVLRVMRLR